MPTISSFYGIFIRMFFNDHAPPHFHVEYGEFKAVIDIATLQVREGVLPRRFEPRPRLDGIASKGIDGGLDAMPSETNPKADSSATVSNPAPMRWDVVEIKVVGDLTLRVHFADGLTGHVRFLPSHLTGVFAPLIEPAFFAQAFVDHGAVAWPGDIDLAPDAMYQAIKSRGEWVLA